MADGAWNVAANWDNGVPGPADAAIFDPAKSNKNVIRSDTIAATVAKLTINLNYTGTIRLKSLTVGHDLGRCTSTLQNGIISVADIGFVKIHSGTFNWSAGTIESRFRPAPPPGPGKPSHPPTFFVDPGATANLTGSANFAGNFDLLNEGTMIVSTSNNITVGNGSTVTNSGTLDVQSDIGFVGMPLRGQGGFDNSGSFKKSAGTGQTRLYMPFTNSGGDLEVRAGMVYLVASGKQTNGKTTIYAGATLGSPTTYEVSEGILQGQGVGTSTVIGNLTLAGGDFYVGTNGTIATFRVTNNYIQTGGTLHIDVDGKQRQQSDLLIAENTAMLGGNLTVHTLNGRKPANAVAILKHGGRQNDFASKTYLGGVTYTPDLSQMFKEYALKP